MDILTAPFGSWKSPITSDLIVAGTIGLGQIALDGADVYWVESRPAEAGRNVIVRRTPDGRSEDVLPAPFNARSRVHEYGGRSFAVAEGVVYFSNFADQRVYGLARGGEPQPITPEDGLRYGDFLYDSQRKRLYAVREDHRVAGREPENTLVVIDLEQPGAGEVQAAGLDFYSSPALSPDGGQLAWLAWKHPNMPWDGTELWVGEFGHDGALGWCDRVAGGTSEAIFQPQWGADGTLYFVSDRTGWWNLYRWRAGEATCLAAMEAEFGEPQWRLGPSMYAVEAPGRIVCVYQEASGSRLAALDPATGELRPFDTPYTSFAEVRARPGQVFFVGGSPAAPSEIAVLDLETGKVESLRRSSTLAIDPGYVSVPESIEFPTEGGLTAHALWYRPQNKDYRALEGERPPLLVLSHGGPTGATSSAFNVEIQYWTSRGFAVLDVNYGGSTGYGRAYRERLKGRWGIVDVDDCANGARFLAEQGAADEARLAIRGGSAGGYTTLAALTFRDVFRAGASYYGISDLEAMARDTHKYESRYLDGLIGPYPERRDIYVERSPIHHVDRLSCPIILFQGLEDKVVPPNQAEMMVEAARRKGLPVAYVPFEGEQHGFRKAENIKRALDAELYFYSKVFGFELAEPVEPVEIENL